MENDVPTVKNAAVYRMQAMFLLIGGIRISRDSLPKLPDFKFRALFPAARLRINSDECPATTTHFTGGCKRGGTAAAILLVFS